MFSSIGRFTVFIIINSLPFIIYEYSGALVKNFKKEISIYHLILKYLTITSIIVILGLMIILIDVLLFRGYHLIPEIPITNNIDNRHNFEYSVSKVKNGYEFTFKNNDFSFYFFETYRNQGEFISLPDSSFFKHFASRSKFQVDSIVFKEHGGFACGTGLGPILILPYEEFTYVFNSIYDFIPAYNYKFLQNTFHNPDSISVKFFISIFRVGSSNSEYVYSNEIEIRYDEMMQLLGEKMALNPYVSSPGSIF